MTAATEDALSRRPMADIPPQIYIPEEMLLFPPDSLQALAVGWNLTGGKRVYAKRQIRGREKFVGKWRHWDLDGTRDVAEMDDPDTVFEHTRPDGGFGCRITDWKGMRRDPWWDWDGLGGPNGQPPLSFTNFPQPPPLRTRELGAFEWGVYPEITAEMAYLANRTGVADEQEVISEHLRPLRPRQAVPPSGVTNVYDDPMGRGAGDWVRGVMTGDVRGEAYLSSVETFVAGAVQGAERRVTENGIKVEEGGTGLDGFVRENCHNGVLRSKVHSIVQQTLQSLHKLTHPASTDIDRSQLLTLARTAFHRLALRNLTSASNPLDIALLLREPNDFQFQSVGGKKGVKEGLDWAGKEISRLNLELFGKAGTLKRARSSDIIVEKASKKVKLETDIHSAVSSPLTAPPDSPPEPASTTEEAMKRLRLELVALSKFYPLAGLKKMDPKDAERLLPENARKLMSKTS